MHMADALISPAVGGVMLAATVGVAVRATRKVEGGATGDGAAIMGVMGAFVFAAQMINFAIPGTGSSGHLGGGLLLAILLGPCRGFLALASVLLIQALFFADGGLLAWGCNVFNLGFFPCFVAYPLLYRPLAARWRSDRGALAASLIASVAGLQLGALGVVAETVLSGKTSLTFGAFALLMLPVHLAIGAVEGAITAAVVAFVRRHRPELANGGVAGSSPGRLTGVMACLALLTGCCLSWFASPKPDGLEWALDRAGVAGELDAGGGLDATLADWQNRAAILPEYGFRDSAGGGAGGETEREAWPAVRAGTSLSGAVGAGLTLVLIGALGFAVSAVRRRRGHGRPPAGM